jgi:lysozyme family protein
MALFDPAFDFMLPHEGTAYVCDPRDPGGATKYGISQRAYPDIDIENLTLDGAKTIYQRRYWLPIYERIMSQECANKVFDMSVNMGTHESHKLVQRACGVTADGDFGPATLAAVNATDPDALLNNIRGQAVEFYMNLVAQRPSSAKFLKGWLRRARA